MRARDCMRHLRRHVWFSWIVLIFCSVPCNTILASASLDEARRLFSDGQDQFRTKQFEAAYNSFRKIERLGYDAPVLQFNIGSAALKAGRLLEAREAFLKASVTTRFEALSYFNLGIIAVKREKRAEALTWFTRSYGATTNKYVRSLCVEMSARLMEELERETVFEDDWHVSAGAGLGYEDGFIDPLDESIKQSTVFVDVGTLAQKRILKGPNWYSMGRGELFHTRNDIASELDSTLLGIAVETHLERKIGRGTFAFGVNDLILGDTSYETVTHLSTQWSYDFSAVNTTLRYELSYHSPAVEFSNLKGTEQEWRGGIAWRWKAILFSSHYQFETNNRADLYEDGTFSNSSPDRHQLGLGVRWDFTARHTILASADLRRTQYQSADVDIISEQKGVETRSRSRTQWIYKHTSRLTVSLTWEYLENESPRQEFAFARHHVRLGCDYGIF